MTTAVPPDGGPALGRTALIEPAGMAIGTESMTGGVIGVPPEFVITQAATSVRLTGAPMVRDRVPVAPGDTLTSVAPVASAVKEPAEPVPLGTACPGEIT